MDDSLSPILGAIVSAQVYDADTDEVTIVQSTITSSADGHEGEYLMYLEPGIYAIVVTADGFKTTYKQITPAYNTDYTEDFILTTALMGLITVDLILPSNDSGEPAIIEFRQDTPEYGVIAVMDVNYSESGSYDVSLPSGAYSIIAAYDDLDRIISGDVLTGQSILIDFTQP